MFIGMRFKMQESEESSPTCQGNSSCAHHTYSTCAMDINLLSESPLPGGENKNESSVLSRRQFLVFI